MRCVDLYNQAQSKWFEEMVTTTLVSTCQHRAWFSGHLGWRLVGT